MYRIRKELNKHGITLKEAFNESNKYNTVANNIVNTELKKTIMALP